MTSSRLPGKALRTVAGRPLLGYAIDRLRHASVVGAIVVATSDDPSDDPIEAFCRSEDIAFHRGSLNDVAARARCRPIGRSRVVVPGQRRQPAAGGRSLPRRRRGRGLRSRGRTGVERASPGRSPRGIGRADPVRRHAARTRPHERRGARARDHASLPPRRPLPHRTPRRRHRRRTRLPARGRQPRRPGALRGVDHGHGSPPLDLRHPGRAGPVAADHVVSTGRQRVDGGVRKYLDRSLAQRMEQRRWATTGSTRRRRISSEASSSSAPRTRRHRGERHPQERTNLPDQPNGIHRHRRMDDGRLPHTRLRHLRDPDQGELPHRAVLLPGRCEPRNRPRTTDPRTADEHRAHRDRR
ncbi:MAG: hypothetical protein IPG46_07245 [Actinobacteria bacterium]|nr:hypothetical protein [Actinomycetota bacterium]